MMEPAVYRNARLETARLEARIATLEVLATGLFESMAAMAIALAQLNELVQLRMMENVERRPDDRVTH